jgi:hypothetical protein
LPETTPLAKSLLTTKTVENTNKKGKTSKSPVRVVIDGLTRNPLQYVKHLLTDIRGLRVKPAMTG